MERVPGKRRQRAQRTEAPPPRSRCPLWLRFPLCREIASCPSRAWSARSASGRTRRGKSSTSVSAAGRCSPATTWSERPRTCGRGTWPCASRTPPHPMPTGVISPRRRRSTRWYGTTSRRGTARSTTGHSRCASPSTPARSWRPTSSVGCCAGFARLRCGLCGENLLVAFSGARPGVLPVVHGTAHMVTGPASIARYLAAVGEATEVRALAEPRPAVLEEPRPSPASSVTRTDAGATAAGEARRCSGGARARGVRGVDLPSERGRPPRGGPEGPLSRPTPQEGERPPCSQLNGPASQASASTSAYAASIASNVPSDSRVGRDAAARCRRRSSSSMSAPRFEASAAVSPGG